MWSLGMYGGLFVCLLSALFATSSVQGLCTVPAFSPPVDVRTDECRAGTVVETATQCVFFCGQPGYLLEGNETISCFQDGSFSSQPPSCRDVEVPVITCPPNITTSNEVGQNYANVPIDEPIVTDNSGDIVMNLPESYLVFLGTSAIRFEAVDGSGNSAACSVYVTVQDTEPPEVTCPSTFNVTTEPGLHYAIVSWGDIAVTDNSGQHQLTGVSYPSGSKFPIGLTTVTVTATDFSSNIGSCSFDVIVRDVEPPTVTCADPVVTTTDPGLATASVSIQPPTVEDNSNPIVNRSEAYIVEIPIGSYEIVFSATDKSGNIGTCSVLVTVRDGEAPVLTCPDDITVTAPPDSTRASAFWSVPDVTDNADAVVAPPVSDPPSGSFFDIGVSPVTVTAIDASGNVANCSFFVTVLDFDECEEIFDVSCSEQAECSNTPGGYSCQCIVGYAGDGQTCEDIDECTTSDHDCDLVADCVNAPGSFTCECSAGYTGDGRECSNIDECEAGTDSCDQNADCSDTDGSFMCTCRAGYRGDGISCTDIDECEEGETVCHSLADCSNVEGSYTCTCRAGYTGDGEECINIDECAATDHGCDANADCVDLEGTFRCECRSGYDGDGSLCTDIDECVGAEAGCDENAECVNTEGSYLCRCLPGFSGDGVTCGVFNLCETLDPCPSVTDCMNEIDSYSCQCRNGYLSITSSDDGSMVCVDIDECSSSTASCDVNAVCINTAGSYECICQNGFSGDGFSCVDETITEAVDPCLSSPCINGGTCVSSDGAYTCRCPATHMGTNCNTVIVDNEPMEVVEHPASQESTTGETVSLSCAFQNAESFVWKLNSRVLETSSSRSPLVLDPVRASDQGYYSCIGTSVDGDELETDIAVVRLTDVTNYIAVTSFDLTFNSSLLDQSSAYFIQTAERIESYVDIGLHNSPEFSSPPESRVDVLSAGSVVAELSIFVTNRAVADTDQLVIVRDALVSHAENSDGFMDPASVSVLSTLTCPFLSWESPYGPVNFIEGVNNAQTFSTGSCPEYKLNNGQPIGTALCMGDGVSPSYWDPEDNCGRNLTADEQLTILRETPVTTDNALDVAETTSELTSSSETLTSDGVAAASKLLEDIAKVASPEPEVCGFVVETVQNLLSAPASELAGAQADGGATSRVVQALEDQLMAVDVAQTNGTYLRAEENLAVAVVEVSSGDLRSGLAASLSISSSMNKIAPDDFKLVRGKASADEVDDDEEPDALLALPSEIGDIAAGTGSDVRCSFTTFADPALFQSPSLAGTDEERNQTAGYRAANTPVISAAVGDVPVTNLTEPVVVSFKPLIGNATNATCVFWDFGANNGSGDWSTDGCRLSNTSTDARPVCECTHLTNFAVLMDIYGGSTLSDREDFILEILSYVGCCMSIVGLVITILTYSSNRKLRSKNPNQILLCLAASLLGLYLTFVVMIALDAERGVVELDVIPCSIVAGILHFFTLASLAWMCVEGFNMYLMFVRVVDSYVSNFIFKAALCAWGLPAVTVFISAGVTRETYAQTDFCFISLWPLVGGLLIPVGLILLFNIVVFGLVMKRLTKTVKGKQKNEKSERRQRLRRLQNAVCILLLMGLTWSVGYLSLIRATSVAVQGLFTVLNSLQGYFIFMLYCVRQPQIRRQWRAQFSCCLPESLRVSLDSTSSRFSSTMNTRTTTTWKPNNQPSTNKNGLNTVSKFNPNSVPTTTTENLGSRLYKNNQI